MTKHMAGAAQLALLALAVVGAAATFQSAAAAEEPDRLFWQGDGWQVAILTENARFAGCYAMKDFPGSGGYGDRVRFVFANYRDERWLGFVGGSNIETLVNQQISISIDGMNLLALSTRATRTNAAQLGVLAPATIEAIATALF